MKREIERKFLVVGEAWRNVVDGGKACKQGYIVSDPSGATVRVRRIGEQGFLTLKGPTKGISRAELEYEIPADEADYMLHCFCGDRVISKIRYLVIVDGMQWEVDEFLDKNQGLVLAEIELDRENQSFGQPDWLGDEVSHDSRYFNAALARAPITEPRLPRGVVVSEEVDL